MIDKNAAKVLAELREDHKNMALMLNLLLVFSAMAAQTVPSWLPG